jgi:creatinine amidohydrolase
VRSIDLAQRVWPQAATGELLAVPLGSLEQHGPHLPLDTDSRIALEVVRRLAGLRPGVVVAPTVAYGSSGEHESFPGTISIGQEALEFMVIELVRSATRTFAHVLVVSGHGRQCGTPGTRRAPAAVGGPFGAGMDGGARGCRCPCGTY